MDFTGKVALVTRAANGIGRSVSLGFAERGTKLVLVDRAAAAGESTAGVIRQQGGEAIFVAADVTRSADKQGYVKAALDKFDAINCFHHNAGIEGTVAPTGEYDEAMFEAVMNTASVARLVAAPAWRLMSRPSTR